MQTANRSCPICEQRSVEFLHQQKFALPEGHPLSDGYEVVCCNSCGFVYADTTVRQEAYDRFYTQYSKYEDKKTGTGGVENEWDRRRVEETAGQVADFLNKPDARVLDVGCANGGLLKALKEKGYFQVLGIDPSPVCVENTRQLGVPAEIGSLFQSLHTSAFDCIILSHTLEHVQDLKQAAMWIKTALSESASVYIEVPDASRYADFVHAPFQDFNTEHINHFSFASLKNYLRVNGLEPVRSGDKIIPASADKPYPAIYCFAQKSEIGRIIEKDVMLRPRIEAYIMRSKEMLAAIDARLQAAFGASKRVIVWGTGQLAMKLLVETSLRDAEIVAFVDSNPINQGKILQGVKVLAPSAIDTMKEPIIITSTLHQWSIVQQIRKMNLKNELILLED